MLPSQIHLILLIESNLLPSRTLARVVTVKVYMVLSKKAHKKSGKTRSRPTDAITPETVLFLAPTLLVRSSGDRSANRDVLSRVNVPSSDMRWSNKTKWEMDNRR